MSILITSDLHLSDNPRDAYRHIFMRGLPEYAKQNKLDAVLILGDLTENKDHHGAELVNSVVKHLYKLAYVCPVIILQGNHDWLMSPENPYFGFLRFVSGITWINKITRIQELSLPEKVHALLEGAIFLPYTNKAGEHWKELDFSHYRYVFAHQTFSGVLGDNGRLLDGLPATFFPKAISVISGDVHVPQQLGQITYVGAPYHIDFGDDFSARMLLLDDRGRITSVPYEGPQKYLLSIKDLSDLKKKKFTPEDILKVRFDAQGNPSLSATDIISSIRKWGEEHNYYIYTIQVLQQDSKFVTSTYSEGAVKSDKELVVHYAKEKNVDRKTVDMGVNLL